VAIHTERLKHATEKLYQQIQVLLQQKSAAFSAQAALLDTISPLATLARGYAIIRRKKTEKKQEEIITRSGQVNPGEQIEIVLHDGRLECEVNRVVAP
jgi:exodeoxyribonuclease VII large subunit